MAYSAVALRQRRNGDHIHGAHRRRAAARLEPRVRTAASPAARPLPAPFSFTVGVSFRQVSSSDRARRTRSTHRSRLRHVTCLRQSCSVEPGCVNVCGTFGARRRSRDRTCTQLRCDSPHGESLNGLALQARSQPGSVVAVQVTVRALGATTSINPIFYVYRHIAITQTTWLCGNSPSSAHFRSLMFGGTPNGKPTMRVAGVTGFRRAGGATVTVQGVTGGCTSGSDHQAAASRDVVGRRRPSPIPGSRTHSMVRVSATGPITIVLVDQSPCGAAANCTSNPAVIDISV